VLECAAVDWPVLHLCHLNHTIIARCITGRYVPGNTYTVTLNNAGGTSFAGFVVVPLTAFSEAFTSTITSDTKLMAACSSSFCVLGWRQQLLLVVHQSFAH
jgi:hypothetical protein